MHDAVECVYAIAPANFFTLFVCSGGVMNGTFVYPVVHLGYKGGNFWFKAKSALLQFWGNSLNGLAPEKFIAGFHIADV